MTSRQAGHFFFEPKGYDHVNQATHEHKEEIKVGYNLQRKVVLMAIWALSPLVLLLDPTLFGLFTPWATLDRLHPSGRQDLARGRRRRPAVPHRAPVLHPRRRDRPRLDDQDPHRPLPRLQALSQGAAGPAARRADRSRPREHRARSKSARRATSDDAIDVRACLDSMPSMRRRCVSLRPGRCRFVRD